MVQFVVELAASKVFLFGRVCNHNSITLQRRFRSHYGVTPRHTVLIWECLEDAGIIRYHPSARIEHLLWTLDLLKTDATEHVLRGRYREDEKTIRKWTTIVIEALSDLNEVSKSTVVVLVLFSVDML